MTKTDQHFSHTKKRFNERYDTVFDKDIQDKLVNFIQNDNKHFRYKLSNYKSVHIIQVNGEQAKLVYDKKRHIIMTVTQLGKLDRDNVLKYKAAKIEYERWIKDGKNREILNDYR